MAYISKDSWLVFLLCIGVGSFVILNSLENPEGFGIGPNGYVKLLCGALIALGIVTLLQEIVGRKKTAVYSEKPEISNQAAYIKVASIMVASLIFMLLLKYFGFFSSGIMLMVSSSLIIRGFPLPKAKTFCLQLLFSIGTVLFVYLSFSVFIGVDLP
jgi:hypothetical protein